MDRRLKKKNKSRGCFVKNIAQLEIERFVCLRWINVYRGQGCCRVTTPESFGELYGIAIYGGPTRQDQKPQKLSL